MKKKLTDNLGRHETSLTDQWQVGALSIILGIALLVLLFAVPALI